ncbi:MAG: serine/threonine protein phosphatase [Cyanobacteria bacterium SIG28]|nr:serine/threonine protein phosphatase [Cyanobacteria bacterium SIG28]
MFVDVDFAQEKKYNQNAYGDYFASKRFPETGRLIAVLSDGLGSGIKANILASMTATMLLRFIEEEVDIKKACEIVMNSLPVCQVRKISYSTFSAMHCKEDGKVKIVEEGNPQFIWISDGKVMEPECTVVDSVNFPNRHMHLYNIKLKEGDRLIFCSDGVTQAALGSRNLKLGLRREGLIKIILDELQEDPEISSRDLSKTIVRQAILTEPDRKPKDDVSCFCVYFRQPRNSIIFTGPPYHQNKDNYYANLFKSFKGKKAICGGTTASLISRELNIPIKVDMSLNIGKLPAVSYMEGIDLVTEGILTLTKVLDDLEKGIIAEDAAGKLIDFMLDSDCITFMVGAKINQAHYDPNMPIEIEIRKNIIKKIEQVLTTKYMKKVVIKYM